MLDSVMRIEYTDKEFGFTVVWNRVEEHFVECCVYEVFSIDDKGVKYYEHIGKDGEIEGKKDLETAEKYLTATIKWDSCSHFNFGDKDGYIHICGAHFYQEHIKLMRWLYNRAFELMGRKPQRGEEWEKEGGTTW